MRAGVEATEGKNCQRMLRQVWKETRRTKCARNAPSPLAGAVFPLPAQQLKNHWMSRDTAPLGITVSRYYAHIRVPDAPAPSVAPWRLFYRTLSCLPPPVRKPLTGALRSFKVDAVSSRTPHRTASITAGLSHVPLWDL